MYININLLCSTLEKYQLYKAGLLITNLLDTSFKRYNQFMAIALSKTMYYDYNLKQLVKNNTPEYIEYSKLFIEQFGKDINDLRYIIRYTYNDNNKRVYTLPLLKEYFKHSKLISIRNKFSYTTKSGKRLSSPACYYPSRTNGLKELENKLYKITNLESDYYTDNERNLIYKFETYLTKKNRKPTNDVPSDDVIFNLDTCETKIIEDLLDKTKYDKHFIDDIPSELIG